MATKTTDFPIPDPDTGRPVTLNILTVDPSAMENDARLSRLIASIEETGARVRRLFPSADFITVESSRSQASRLRGLPGITGIDTQQPKP